MSTRWEQSCEGCLFTAMSFLEEIVHRNQRINELSGKIHMQLTIFKKMLILSDVFSEG